MSAKADGRPAQRVVEKGIPLLDCTRTRKGIMQLRLPASGAVFRNRQHSTERMKYQK